MELKVAKVFFKTDNVEHEVEDGTPLIDFVMRWMYLFHSAVLKEPVESVR